MAPTAPVALPPRFTAARQARIVGRRYELGVLDGAWERVRQGHGQLVLLGGEPGAGKTRLAAEVAGALHEHDVVVLVGTATRDAGVPYQPFVEMLDRLLLAGEPGALADLLADTAPELRRLSERVDRHVPGDATPNRPVGTSRRPLFEAVTRTFRRMAEDRPLAVVLDDLHWAQVPTLALLEHVVHSCLDTRMLVLGTFRTTAPDRSAELSSRLADLHRLDGVRRLDLAGLDTDAIAEFVCLHGRVSAAGARAPAAILRDRTGGNPFFLRETWTDLERHGGVSALRGPQRVPVSIGDTLAARLSGLGERVREIIDLAAVLGDHFDLPTLVRASAAEGAQSMDAVDSATAVGLIEAVVGTPGRYAFVHSLTRQAVLDRLPQARRTMLHARVAQALECRHDPALTPRIAHHYLAAHLLGHHEPALRYAVAAARQAVHSLAFEEAAMWFDRAATLPDTEQEVRAELSFAAAENHLRAGDFAGARVIYERLAAMADPLVRLQAAMGLEEATPGPVCPTAGPPTCSSRPSPTAGSPPTIRGRSAHWAASGARWPSPDRPRRPAWWAVVRSRAPDGSATARPSCTPSSPACGTGSPRTSQASSWIARASSPGCARISQTTRTWRRRRTSGRSSVIWPGGRAAGRAGRGRSRRPPGGRLPRAAVAPLLRGVRCPGAGVL